MMRNHSTGVGCAGGVIHKGVAQALVWALVLIVVFHVLVEQVAEVTLSEGEHVIQALPANRSA